MLSNRHLLHGKREDPEIARAGDLGPGRSFLAELERWFPGHADYLDSALAAWMFKREFGGKPVVLHRKRPGVTTSG